jgi:hypothetical protein
MILDSDFVPIENCVARTWMPRIQRWFVDLACRLLGHNLWRPGSVRPINGMSLPLKASYCRRCFKGGYVQGDYHR